MTTVLLHGGYKTSWQDAGRDHALFQKLAAAAVSEGKMMISFLAQKRIEDFPHLEEMLETFNKLAPSIKIDLADRSNFTELLPKHRVIFLQGGHSQTQELALQNISGKELSSGKTLIAGSSSGAMQICKWGYSNSGEKPIQGKGLIDIAVIPHANAWPVAEYSQKLREAPDCPAILLLDEMQTVTFNIQTQEKSCSI